MASRFYLHASGAQPAPTAPTFDAGWEQTGQATRLPMELKAQLTATTTLTDSSSITVPITTTQQILCYQFTSRQVFHPVRLDASVRFSLVIRGRENATTNNVDLAYVLRAFSAQGDRALATLASSMTTATEFAATAATRIFGNGTTTVALTATTIGEAWRLVLEVGGHAQAPTAAGSYIYRVGCSAASDFALTSALTTDLNPWMELSVSLEATQVRSHQAFSAGSGVAVVAERFS